MIRRAVLPGVLLAALLVGCSHTAGGEFALAQAAAERAYGAGRYEEAAMHWNDAAAHATRGTDRDEARYRQAASLARAGDRARAIDVLDALLAASPDGDRAARAAFDRAHLLIESGDPNAGFAGLDWVLRTHPRSGLGPPGLRTMVDHVREQGEPALRDYLTHLEAVVRGTGLDDWVDYARAESLEREGDLGAARDEYLAVARMDPYPKGPLWDDALFRAAELAERLGDPRAALGALEQMLDKRERAYFNGTYERERYAEARFRIGEIYRDELSDPANARRSFELLFTAHTTSRLRDDAEWNAAVLAAKEGDRDGACRDLGALATQIPDSRYVPCARTLCPTLDVRTSGGECHPYLIRGVTP